MSQRDLQELLRLKKHLHSKSLKCSGHQLQAHLNFIQILKFHLYAIQLLETHHCYLS